MQGLDFVWNHFGVSNGPAFFSRHLADTLSDTIGRVCSQFLDDLAIYSSRDIDEHIEALREVFERVRKRGYKFKLSKCHFGFEEITHLGYRIGNGCLMTDPIRLKLLKNFLLQRMLNN